MSLESFTEAYVTAALWSSTWDDEPLDKEYCLGDIADKTYNKMQEDCAVFYAQYSHLFTSEYCDHSGCSVDEYAGHDFWLTRNGHGCGFWDGDWEKGVGELLTTACEALGSVELYVGDDNRVYAMGSEGELLCA